MITYWTIFVLIILLITFQRFASSLRKLCFREKFFFEILVSQYSEESKTSRNVIFSWRPDVCVCDCVSDFQRLKPR